MVKSRVCAILLCLSLVLIPGWLSHAKPVDRVKAPEPKPFAVTPDGWNGYWMCQWKTGAWAHRTYAGLWTPSALPKKGDREKWARAQIAKEIVGVEGLEVAHGLFAQAPVGVKPTVKFRRDPNATHTKIVWDNGVVVIGKDPKALADLTPAIRQAIDVAANYDVHKGWVTGSFFRTIASPMEHPVDATAAAMALGCDWIIWAYGQQDHLTAADADAMIKAATPGEAPAMLTLAGQTISRGAWHQTKEGWHITILGSERAFDYQDIDKELKYYVDRARDGGGYVFANATTYRGAAALNKKRQLNDPIVFDGVDSVDAKLLQTTPFVSRGGRNLTPEAGKPSAVTATAVLLPRGTPLTKQSLFAAIKARRAVHMREVTEAVGKKIPGKKRKTRVRTVFDGPKDLTRAVGMLLLSKTYLEKQFKTDLVLSAKTANWNRITVTVTNRGAKPFTGALGGTTETAIIDKKRRPLLTFPDLPERITLAPGKTATFTSRIAHGQSVSGKDLAILVTVSDKAGKPYKRALARVTFPKALVALPKMVLAPGKVRVPFTIWNSSARKKVEYTVRVHRRLPTKANPKPVKKSVPIAPHTSGTVHVEVDAKAGDTFVSVQALGRRKTTHLIVREQKGGKIKHWFADMNKDGKDELYVENDHVKAIFLLQGSRLIRFWNKQNGDNVFCEIWPENPPKRKKETDRSFWPYGGLEEFISYPKIDAHTWYKHKILRDDGRMFSVEFTAVLHGQKLKKIYTLYAGSGLLEMRYAYEFDDESIHIIGVNPIISIGKDCDAHDLSIFPTKDGIATHRYSPDRMHGAKYDIVEGWAASYDEREKSSLIQSFPLDDMLIMHLWNNTPQNSATHYFYTELQPWFLIDTHTTTYYSYYLLPHAGPWQDGLKKMKSLGITPQKKN